MASGVGSRFAVLDGVGKDSHVEKKDKKEKKQAKEKKDKKELKERKEKKVHSVERSDDAADLESKRNSEIIQALHALLVSIFNGGCDSSSRARCQEALDWLGLDVDAAAICAGPAAAADMLGKVWPRMLRKLAVAVDREVGEEGMPPSHLAELWSIGGRLSEDDVRCSESCRLQAALEKKFEQSRAFRKAVQAWESRGKRLNVEFPPPATCEVSVEEKPLSLFGRPPGVLAFAEGAPRAQLIDDSRRCFAFHWPQLIAEEAARKRYFRRLKLAAPWSELKRADESVKRSTCWYVRGGCTCDYTYGSERIQTSAADFADGHFTEIMEELTAVVFRAARPDWPESDWPNSANLNLYSDGSQSVGWHADDESLFMGKTDDCLIVSLSLGTSRDFWIALNKGASGQAPRADTKAFISATLKDGDLFTMEGLFQKHFLHKVPSADEAASELPCVGERINVTWRWIRDHKRRCPLGRGRQ